MQTIDLSQNAISLIGIARHWAPQMGLNKESIIKDMQSGDHEHLKSVFKKHFSNVCTIIDSELENDFNY
jgi:hypothetical protein